jgi:hypothetical protein
VYFHEQKQESDLEIFKQVIMIIIIIQSTQIYNPDCIICVGHGRLVARSNNSNNKGKTSVATTNRIISDIDMTNATMEQQRQSVTNTTPRSTPTAATHLSLIDLIHWQCYHSNSSAIAITIHNSITIRPLQQQQER